MSSCISEKEDKNLLKKQAFKIIIIKNLQENNTITSWEKIGACQQQQEDSSISAAAAVTTASKAATVPVTADVAATAATAAATAATAVTSSPSSSWGQRRQHSGFAPPLVPL